MTYWQQRRQKISFAVGQVLCMRNPPDEWTARRHAANAEAQVSGTVQERQDIAIIRDRMEAEIDAVRAREILKRLKRGT